MPVAKPRAIHTRKCRSREGRRCSRSPTWQVGVYDAGKRWRRNFTSRAEALTFAEDTARASRNGQLTAPSTLTVAEAWEMFLPDAQEGKALSRSRTPYTASTLDGYETKMRERGLPRLGKRNRSDVR